MILSLSKQPLICLLPVLLFIKSKTPNKGAILAVGDVALKEIFIALPLSATPIF